MQLINREPSIMKTTEIEYVIWRNTFAVTTKQTQFDEFLVSFVSFRLIWCERAIIYGVMVGVDWARGT